MVIDMERSATHLLKVATLHGKRALFVDDDEAQREVVTEILELEGMEVFNAPTALEAIRLLEQGPDILLLDLHGVSSEEIVAAIDRLARRPVVLVLSGDVRLSQHAERLRADGFLAKPYDLDDLVRAVAGAIEARGTCAPIEADHPAAQ